MRKQHDLQGVPSLSDAFERAVRRAADRTALEYGDVTLTYRELNARANRLARRLQREDVRPGTRVGMHVSRSIELYVTLLALLKAGACVVPLNPAHPLAVRRAVAAEAALPLVVGDGPIDLGEGVTVRDAAGLLAGSAGLADTDLGLAADPESTAFILFTSGSTGRPKGVRIAHRGISRIADHNGEVAVGPGDAFLQLAALSFAASTTDIWLSLLHGARLVVAPPELPSLPDLAATITERKVTFLNLPCGLFNLLVTHHPDALREVRTIIISGEFASPPHLARALRATDATIYNAFGCTENSALTAVHRVTEDDLGGGAVPVGRPLPGVTMHVLDGSLRPCPPGEVGELCIGGAGVALGYLNAPALTAQKFVDDPLRGSLEIHTGAVDHPVLLRTGDLARTTPGGEIALVGRTDQMVKIRGFRVETREVELALRQAAPVDQVVVKAFDAADNLKELVAFYTTGDDAPVPVGDLLAGLRERLPDYMHPARFHHRTELPVNLNGKVDRMALEEPRDARPAAAGAPVDDPLASVIAGLYRTIAGVPELGTRDSFIAAGGNSLQFIQLAAGLRQVLGVTVQAEDVFQHDTAESLAARVEEIRAGVPARTG
ncbi:adenylation domain-containing protein [Actinomadura craniellae]|uniref:Adenylation domain-containing protein n=1 Tax=Actinomadura craniellae TaxID=2231787 RepID=A0A365H0N4_9ACTN|nr:non-ribosomal peptide synthetase [Actinomadura craniellae]RAY12588.1 adenylation domain-containing protein [Actinomadura craniellae]